MQTAELAAHPLTQVARVLTWGALGLLAYGALSWMVAQSWFALRTLDIKTPVQHVTEAQIRLVARRTVRGTFFTVNLDQVRGSLEKLPWVREARVARRWPDTLEVSLIEHVPLARWNDDALVNGDGEVFVAAVVGKLPRLTGPDDSSADVVAAFRHHQKMLAPLGMSISELRLSPRRAWSMRLDNGIQLALGHGEADARLARFVALYPRLFAAVPASATASVSPQRIPQSIDLRYPDGFAIRMPDGQSPFKPRPT
ncbi:MAG: cell division protein FtsQ/DivIB [Thiobacillus sp.]